MGTASHDCAVVRRVMKIIFLCTRASQRSHSPEKYSVASIFMVVKQNHILNL